MMPIADMLKATEAAVVSRVTLRDVNRTIDEGILPAGLFTVAAGRGVAPAACVLISFYFGSAGRLTAEERLRAIRRAEPVLRRWGRGKLRALPAGDWIIRDAFLAIDLSPFAAATVEGLDRLGAARAAVACSPDVLGGVPVLRGTRVPVHDVAAARAAGMTDADILEDYPALTAEAIGLAALYAAANPARGRPRPLSAVLPAGTRMVAERRVARRGRA